MVIKNNGRKIIGFGQISVLPGETATIPDTFKDNSTLEAFISLGFVEVVGSKTTDKTETKTGKGGKTAGKTETKTDSTDGTDTETKTDGATE